MESSGASPRTTVTDRSLPTLVHRIFDRTLIFVAIGFMAYGAFWPIYGELPGRGVQTLTLAAIVTTALGGLIAPRGSRPAFTLLWVAFGMAAGLGTVGIFRSDLPT